MSSQQAMQQQGWLQAGVYSDDDDVNSLSIQYQHFSSLDGDVEVQGDVAMQGQQLYLDFLRREIRNQQLEEPASLQAPNAATYLPDNQDLGQLLDRFSQSEERLRVRQKADEVQLEGISYEGFAGLLSGLFQEDGITYERVLVLFCFCTDLCLRALRETASRCFHLMTNFSLRFITSTLCVWVQARGGWGAVLNGLRQGCGSYVAAIGCLAVVAVGAAIWSK